MKFEKHDTKQQTQQFWSGVSTFQARLNRQKALYAELLAYAEGIAGDEVVIPVQDPILFRSTLKEFGPALDSDHAPRDLSKIFDVAVDLATGTLIIANKGATVWSLSPKTETPYLTRHIGFALYIPGLGIETVNVGLVGNVYEGKVAVRGESACTPSFVFGSQRCNCAHQWDSFRELAAHFNPRSAPALRGAAFERWVQEQYYSEQGRHLFKQPGPGMVMVHLDSQNGMGSGVSKNEFSVDLFNRASLRHRGEYAAEQVFNLSMAGAFKALGLNPDPRSNDEALGYCVLPIVLDFLKISRDLILFSNNQFKIRALRKRGYAIDRVKSLGKVNAAGALEALQRGTEFGHFDINDEEVTFNDECSRLRMELEGLFKNSVEEEEARKCA